MSLVDYDSSSDEEDSEVAEDDERGVPKDNPSPPAAPQPPRNQLARTSSNLEQQSSSHTVVPSMRLPDASVLLNSPVISSNLMGGSDHSSRVAAAMAESASRKRDSNGSATLFPRSKVPKGNLPHSRNVPDTVGRLLLPPQLGGRSNVVTEDIGRLFVKSHGDSSRSPPS